MRRFLPRHVRHFPSGPIGLLVTTLLGVGCERSQPASGQKDTVVVAPPLPETTVVAPPEVPTWDSTAGAALFVVGPSPREALIISPLSADSSRADSSRFNLTIRRALLVDLFAGGARVGQARIGPIAASTSADSCRAWPIARLDLPSTDTASTHDWAVGFESNRAAEMPLDSIAGLPTADSARLAADIARMASALPGDTSATFRGLPFVVTKAWRTRALGGQVILAAIVVRNVNQEANPRQERILLIAERDTSPPTARYVPRYSERVTGLEETLEATDLIAMVLLGADRRQTLVIARDAGHGSSYALIERIAGVWQRRWTSAYAGC